MSQIINSSRPCRFKFSYELKSFCKVKLHCPVVLSSNIVSLSLPNVKVKPGHRILPPKKVTGLHIFRDLSSKIVKNV